MAGFTEFMINEKVQTFWAALQRTGHGMRRCLWSGSGRAEQSHGIDTVARLRCRR
jgi:hypothetical protein